MAGQGSDMDIQYLDFGRVHGKQEVQGSTYIRMKQMEPFVKPYKYGANPQALIFQKVYCKEDYKFPEHFEGIKILDICDSDWLSAVSIVETCNAMDAIVCPTEPLAAFLRQIHPNVHIVPDRFDTKIIPKPKEHKGIAKSVVWFGYSHNAELIKPAMKTIDDLNLNLTVIANEDPFVHQWSTRKKEDFYTFLRYDEGEIYTELKKADFAILPSGMRVVDRFKSNNKTIKANLIGLPVATTKEDVEKYMDGNERRLWFDNYYDKIKQEYDISNSISQYKEIIKKVQETK